MLEQYYLLDPVFNLNVIKVANNPNSSNAKPLYMYNKYKSILYYFSTLQKDFIKNFYIHFETLKKHLNNGIYYSRKHSFSRKWVNETKISDITVLDLVLRLQKNRIKYNKNKSITNETRTILLTSINDPNHTKLFSGIRLCMKFLKEDKGFPFIKEILIKYITNKKVYQGYLCKFV